MKQVVSTKEIMDKIKNGENAPNLEVVQVVLVQFKLVDNHCQEKYQILYTFKLTKFVASLLNVEPNNLVSLKNYNIDFNQIFLNFMDQNSRTVKK